ncbi:ABC transporter permease [Lachnoclostridium sp. Marseille-P6806]|uniref:ABC transporter permease n=1 Tax=Lachnoclostridium sp. Marseille-P6806 TaxID=2364793 RepID=UPI001031181B|nr:ABC transporter permease [Lachnoclostridium sp. Marseille-P6806]
MAGKSGRAISAAPKDGLRSRILSWEGALVLIFLAVQIFGVSISPNYNFTNVLREMPKYLAEIFMLFGMACILILGDIDISVGSIVCLSATMACFAGNAGAPFPVVVLVCLGIGLLCGMVNGFLAIKLQELPTMIITLGTQIIFRGIAEVTLKSGGSVSMEDVAGLMQMGKKLGPFPLSLFFVVLTAVIFSVLLNRTVFGRELYAVGANKTAAYYAGIEVQKDRFICYSLLGGLAGVCGIFLLASLYGANTTTGSGFEMEVIAMCVFGGIATTGGKGNLTGAFIAAFVIVCIRIALGQRNINTQLILVIIGAMLIISVLLPTISNGLRAKKQKR